MENAVTPVAGQTATTPTTTLKRWFRAFETNKGHELAEQREHRRYYHAKQWTDEEIKTLKSRGQAAIFDNRIARKIDFLVGVEQRMRRDPKAYPRTPKEDHGADAATAGMRYACDVNRWEKLASDGFCDGLISGIGVIFVGIEPGRSGLDPKLKSIAVDRFFYDPRSLNPDFSDARFMGLHLWLDIDEAKERYSSHAKGLDETLLASKGEIGLRSDTDRETQWGDFEHRRVRVVEFWEKRLVDKPQTQPDMMSGTALTQPQKVVGWTYTYFCGDIILDSGISPYVDENGAPDCPYVAWSPYVDETGDRYGPIRNMKPMQDEINHRRSKFLHWLNAKQFHGREGDVDDIDEFKAEMNRPNGYLKHNGEWGKTVGPVDNSQEIKGQAELLAQAQSALENLGPNPGLIGKGGGVADQSGRAILAQRDSGMTELSPVFERGRDWKLRVHRKLWSRIKQAWTGEKWIRITDDPRSPQFLGLNLYDFDPMTGQAMSKNVIADIDVDIIMDEGPDTITMNEELMQTLSQLGELAAGPVGRIMIELSNASNKEKLLEMLDKAVAPDPAVAEMQKRMAKLEELMAAAKVDDTVAATESKRADTLSKLVTAFTPQQQQTDEFGNPIGAPPQQPDLGMGFNAMQMFPLQYGAQTLEQMSLLAPPAGQQQAQQPQMPGGDMGMMPQMPPEMMAGQGALQGLPVDPQLAGQA